MIEVYVRTEGGTMVFPTQFVELQEGGELVVYDDDETTMLAGFSPGYWLSFVFKQRPGLGVVVDIEGAVSE